MLKRNITTMRDFSCFCGWHVFDDSWHEVLVRTARAEHVDEWLDLWVCKQFAFFLHSNQLFEHAPAVKMLRAVSFVGHVPLVHFNQSYGSLKKKRCNEYKKLGCSKYKYAFQSSQ